MQQFLCVYYTTKPQNLHDLGHSKQKWKKKAWTRYCNNPDITVYSKQTTCFTINSNIVLKVFILKKWSTQCLVVNIQFKRLWVNYLLSNKIKSKNMYVLYWETKDTTIACKSDFHVLVRETPNTTTTTPLSSSHHLKSS